jgi:hypothetical protein
MEIYVSVDVESDGPIPGLYSMLNFGAVALDKDKNIFGTYTVNLKPLKGAKQHPDTMKFWSNHPEVWNSINQDQKDPSETMFGFLAWLKEMSKHGDLVFVAYPAGYDFTFIRWYLEYFTGECPFGYQALDVKSYVMAILKTEFKQTTKSKFNKNWFEKGLPHTHLGLDDAMEQGMLFINILNSNT